MSSKLRERMNKAYQGADQSNEGDVASILGLSPDTESVYEQQIQYTKPTQQEVVEPAIEPQITISIPAVEKTIQSTVEPMKQPQEQPKVFSEYPITVSDVSRIIKILEKYNSYEKKIQTNINKIIGTTDGSTADVIHKVLYINEQDKNGFVDLVNLKEEERTSRAFSLMSLTDQRLEKIKEIVSVFNSEAIFEKTDRVGFLRELENAINTLSENALVYLIPIRDLFTME